MPSEKAVESLQWRYLAGGIEAGCDEAGRGCLAGPVFAAAVVLPEAPQQVDWKDSKMLSKKRRGFFRELIEREALSWAVGEASPSEIDQINILQASLLAMHRALEQMKKQPTRILVDGKFFNAYGNTEHHCIVGGDRKFASIAAASILAKTYRDARMAELAEHYPHYGWETNVGYPTKAHRQAILNYDLSPYHRQSFNLKGR